MLYLTAHTKPMSKHNMYSKDRHGFADTPNGQCIVPELLAMNARHSSQ